MNVSTNAHPGHHWSEPKLPNCQSGMNFADFMKNSYNCGEHGTAHENPNQNVYGESILIQIPSIGRKVENISLMEWLALQPKREEPMINGVPASQLPVVDFSNEKLISLLDYELDPKNWTNYFNDPAWVKNVQEGIKFRRQFFDFTNSSKFTEMTKNADHTGMSNAEKYTEIFERYKYCYGEDFLKAFSISYCRSGSNRYEEVYDSFKRELRAAFGDSAGIEKAAREALYGKMSDSEIRETIRNKYPPAGEFNYFDLYHMTNELNQVGISKHLREIATLSFGLYRDKMGIGDPTDYEMRNAMMSRPVDTLYVNTLWDYYSYRVKANFPVDPDLGATIKDLLSFVSKGVNLGGMDLGRVGLGGVDLRGVNLGGITL